MSQFKDRPPTISAPRDLILTLPIREGAYGVLVKDDQVLSAEIEPSLTSLVELLMQRKLLNRRCYGNLRRRPAVKFEC
jgi:hypothetical protein